MSGRKCRYYCKRCDFYFTGIKHHGGVHPKCPKCGKNDQVTRLSC